MNNFVTAYTNDAANAVNCSSSKNHKNPDHQNNNCKIYDSYDWIATKCGADFGYVQGGSPCLFFSLNNLIGWELQGLSGTVNAISGNITGDSTSAFFHCDLWEMIDGKISDTASNAYSMTWLEPDSGVYSNGEASTGGRIPNYFYPYHGHGKFYRKENPCAGQQCGVSPNKPFKVLQLTRNNAASNFHVNLKCHAYADNIQNAYYDADAKKYMWRVTYGQSNYDSSVAYNGQAVLAEFTVDG